MEEERQEFLRKILTALLYAVSSFFIVVINKIVLTVYKWVAHFLRKIQPIFTL